VRRTPWQPGAGWRRAWGVGVVLGLLGALTGCHGISATPPPPKPPPLRLVTVDRTPWDAIDQVWYRSAGRTVGGFLVVPLQGGPYPLLVLCHGGFLVPHPNLAHYIFRSPTGRVAFGYTAATLLTSRWPDNAVVFIPLYRGYGFSGGHVHGLPGDVADVENGLRALSTLKMIDMHEIYLRGVSLGGGIVLELARDNPAVKAVVAISPFVGYDLELTWAPRVNREPWIAEAGAIIAAYGTPLTNAAWYRRWSLYDHAAQITAPVLLLQGTADDAVMWQTVQALADRLRAVHRPVRLIFFPGGNHGLTAPETVHVEAEQDIGQWWAAHGLLLNVPG
jgi:dipeptidyl aminopeptidase/acylaminoacyl peptidase